MNLISLETPISSDLSYLIKESKDNLVQESRKSTNEVSTKLFFFKF